MSPRLRLLTALATVPVLAPTPASALQDVGRSGATPLVALVGLLAWLCGGWLLLVLGLSVLEQRPGRGGQVAGAVLSRMAPRALRLAARLLLGTTLVTGSFSSAAASASSSGHGRAAAVGLPSLDWPVGPPTPALDWPAMPSVTTPPAPAATTVHSADAPVPTGPPTADRNVVMVEPGDCLWSLAERALGAEATPARTAAAWPTWWSANRTVIGNDPDLLQPGTRLLPPA